MTTFQRPIGLREWLYALESRLNRLEAGGVRPIQEVPEGLTIAPATPHEVVPNDATLDEYLRRKVETSG